MKKLLCVWGLALAVCVLSGTVQAAAKDAATRNVVVPMDDKAFAVDKDSLVRLHAKGIAGSTIEAKIVSGPASFVATHVIHYRKNGKPVVGNITKEFELKSTDTGTVKVTVTVTSPEKDSTPKVTTYEYEVK
jgi:hypothetical protein